MFKEKYDVVVVGGGHAGCEAAAASANLGSKTLLVTMSLQNIAQMSCNPAMGGIAKGQIVREIDALGGYSGIVSDRTAIQFKMLNKSKGPAMWSPRVQSDRLRFSEVWRFMLEKIPNLDFYQDMVNDLLIENGVIIGVKTQLGIHIYSKMVILTNGTFLNGVIHIGEKQFYGGRVGENASYGITECLNNAGFVSGRMKTGTPPRVDGRSLDYSKMSEEKGDINSKKFSFSNDSKALLEQKSCYMTYTSPLVHDILREGFSRSPMFNGSIKSIGPRYCPSVEDKINRFADKERHQLFIEPEGWTTTEVYVNGFSTSLPEDIQFKALRKVEGFEHVKFYRPGYAIEYDFFPPTQLKHSLETKIVENLFFAGQINGTTGYEEAAAQGLMAGINAHLKIRKKDPIVLRRDQAYIGVLIDDLVLKGTDEPYRMFTSRAEYRTLLRQDNADYRLTPISFSLGLASKDRMIRMEKKYSQADLMLSFFRETSVSPVEANDILQEKKSAKILQSAKMFKIFSRPQIVLSDMKRFAKVKKFIAKFDLDEEVLEQAEIQLKYSGYIDKEIKNVEKLVRLEEICIPRDFDYNIINSLSIEARQKLTKASPSTIAQASRISGVSPSDISVLLIYMGR